MQSSRLALISLIALSAAGCFSDRGLAIEVDVGDTGATSVALYVGNRTCQGGDSSGVNCDSGIAPPGGGPHLPGKIWFRQDPEPYSAPVVHGKATFRFEASKTTTLPLVVAIGTVAAPTPQSVTLPPPVGAASMTMVDVPIDTARIVTVTLVKAGPIDGAATPTQEFQAVAWRTPADDNSCVILEHVQNNQRERTLIVPPLDPDCDAVKPECDPQAANALNRGDDPKPACYTAASDSTDAPCQLGAFSCSDAMPTSDTCAAITSTQTCAPKPFCDCASKTPAQGCTDPPALPLESVTHVLCTVQVAGDSACQDPHTPIGLKGHFSDGCDQPLLAPSVRLADVIQARQSAHFGPLSLDLQLTGTDLSSCQFRLQVNSGSHLPGDDFGMIYLTSKGKTGSVLVPVIFRFVLAAGCGDAKNVCDLVEPGNDPMWSCAP
jgi:hypothetical protein